MLFTTNNNNNDDAARAGGHPGSAAAGNDWQSLRLNANSKRRASVTGEAVQRHGSRRNSLAVGSNATISCSTPGSGIYAIRFPSSRGLSRRREAAGGEAGGSLHYGINAASHASGPLSLQAMGPREGFTSSAGSAGGTGAADSAAGADAPLFVVAAALRQRQALSSYHDSHAALRDAAAVVLARAFNGGGPGTPAAAPAGTVQPAVAGAAVGGAAAGGGHAPTNRPQSGRRSQHSSWRPSLYGSSAGCLAYSGRSYMCRFESRNTGRQLLLEEVTESKTATTAAANTAGELPTGAGGATAAAAGQNGAGKVPAYSTRMPAPLRIVSDESQPAGDQPSFQRNQQQQQEEKEGGGVPAVGGKHAGCGGFIASIFSSSRKKASTGDKRGKSRQQQQQQSGSQGPAGPSITAGSGLVAQAQHAVKVPRKSSLKTGSHIAAAFATGGEFQQQGGLEGAATAAAAGRGTGAGAGGGAVEGARPADAARADSAPGDASSALALQYADAAGSSMAALGTSAALCLLPGMFFVLHLQDPRLDDDAEATAAAASPSSDSAAADVGAGADSSAAAGTLLQLQPSLLSRQAVNRVLQELLAGAGAGAGGGGSVAAQSKSQLEDVLSSLIALLKEIGIRTAAEGRAALQLPSIMHTAAGTLLMQMFSSRSGMQASQGQLLQLLSLVAQVRYGEKGREERSKGERDH